MKTAIGLACLAVLAAHGMDVLPLESKQETVDRMLALQRSDYEAKYDEVTTQLDLSALMKGNPIICVPSSNRVLYDGSVGDFKGERTLLRELAITKAYTPLIPVLFKRWQHLEAHWIGRSMLLHAVKAGMLTNTNALLNLGVNPNERAYYFFQNHSDATTPGELALGKNAKYNDHQINPDLIQILFASGLQITPADGNAHLFTAIEQYFHGNRDFAFVITALLEKGIDPFAQLGQGSVYANRETYSGSSPYELVSKLVNVPRFSQEECCYNPELCGANEMVHKGLQDLLMTFNKYKSDQSLNYLKI